MLLQGFTAAATNPSTGQEEYAKADEVADRSWDRDSVATEATLAYLLANGGRRVAAGPDVSRLVELEYRRLTGRAGPILNYLSLASGYQRAPVALRAIRSTLSPSESEWVMAFACRAGWLIGAWKADSSFRPYGQWIPEWKTAETTLQQAYRILPDGVFRSDVERMVLTADPEYGRTWLAPR